jgi:hypothetical protein
MAKGQGSMSIAPPPDWYIHAVSLRLLRGEFVALPLDPEAEPSNVHSIEAARTRRATAQMMRGRSWPAEPAS